MGRRIHQEQDLDAGQLTLPEFRPERAEALLRELREGAEELRGWAENIHQPEQEGRN